MRHCQPRSHMAYFLIFVRLSQYTQHRPVGLTLCVAQRTRAAWAYTRGHGAGLASCRGRPSPPPRAPPARTRRRQSRPRRPRARRSACSRTPPAAHPLLGICRCQGSKLCRRRRKTGREAQRPFLLFIVGHKFEHKKKEKQTRPQRVTKTDRHSARAAAPPPPGRSRYARSHRTHPRRGLLIAGSLRRFVSSFAG